MWGTSQKRELIIVGRERSYQAIKKQQQQQQNRSQDRYDRRGESAWWVQTHDFL